ncbi:aldose 1-epimerase family protein [Pedobacter puniceum]|uniref:Aldose 1-epimerase family protein n=1 Tax=Pedobacter puniceum TaxID=2666136 RepID=A0A7K0FKI5_9SPHI|nr:aldose 1-epimerase family protein [Pedobacter puniceum]MRX46141.1 aldose 1-epimerase family protein [Pedobacter puniceum]
MIILENSQLKVTINMKGAELSSLFDKESQTEYIWDAQAAIWAYHAPNLFPIVGNLKDNTLLVDGKTYQMNRHGFARTSTFRRIESAPDHAHFALRYNEETLQQYPYKFEFQVVYQLKGRSLKVMYKVINLDDKRVYFSLGAHPGFKVPLTAGEAYEDYTLFFEHPEHLESSLLSTKGLFNGKTIPVADKGELNLTKTLFDADALVFKTLKSRSVTLKSQRGDKFVRLDFPHFTSLGVWAKPGANFLCIEPWLGYADSDEDLKDISQKEAIQFVEHGHVFETDFTISI